MRTREVINSMTNEELSTLFCEIVESAAYKVNANSVCDLCPVSQMCEKGKNGFRTLLESESTGKLTLIQQNLNTIKI